MSAPVVAPAGAVLAGGAASRFGSDKARARLGPTTLFERVVAALRGGGAAPVVAVGGEAGADRHVPTLADRHPGQGPLGGVITALRWSDRPRTVVVAADLALLDDLTVAALALRAEGCPGSVAMARAGGRLQPTCACWPAGALPALEAAMSAGERSIARAVSALPVEPVDVPERVVADVDTRQDLALLSRWWSR